MKSWMSLLVLGNLFGCASFSQQAHEVLIRDPNLQKYGNAEPAGVHAERQWVYAAMSDFAYEKARTRSFEDQKKPKPSKDREEEVVACGNSDPPQIPDEWVQWPKFPSPKLQIEMREIGLFLLVLERGGTYPEIVIIFEGTNFSELPDWTANLRWFTRFIPGFSDQYTFVADKVSREFFEHIRSDPARYRVSEADANLRNSDNVMIKIVSTGHSLGGGLAQHFAYTVKQVSGNATGPKVSEVFAFDPSPVTGWSTADDPPRTYNASGLRINRVFEHGEILAYIRFLTSRFAISSENPAIWEYRYNFDPKANILRNHSMRSLACGLARAARDGK